jgi:pSer/pThr/pTyr-binding forkhead associated (FHA) protein
MARPLARAGRSPIRYARAVQRDADGSPPPIETTATLPFVPASREPEPAAAAANAATAPAQPLSLPAGVALLVVHHGPNAGARFLLDLDVVTAGRQPESDIFLDDVTVSRQHAEFRRAAHTYSIVDLKSLNGTYVNGERVHRAALAGGDDVQIGKFRMTFRMSDIITP